MIKGADLDFSTLVFSDIKLVLRDHGLFLSSRSVSQGVVVLVEFSIQNTPAPTRGKIRAGPSASVKKSINEMIPKNVTGTTLTMQSSTPRASINVLVS